MKKTWAQVKPNSYEMKLCDLWSSEQDLRSGIEMYAIRIGVNRMTAELYMACALSGKIPEVFNVER